MDGPQNNTHKIIICNYLLDVPSVTIYLFIQPMYYSEKHEDSDEYLGFLFCPAIISCIQFAFMMTYSIFAVREDIFFDLFTAAAAAVATADI